MPTLTSGGSSSGMSPITVPNSDPMQIIWDKNSGEAFMVSRADYIAAITAIQNAGVMLLQLDTWRNPTTGLYQYVTGQKTNSVEHVLLFNHIPFERYSDYKAALDANH